MDIKGQSSSLFDFQYARNFSDWVEVRASVVDKAIEEVPSGSVANHNLIKVVSFVEAWRVNVDLRLVDLRDWLIIFFILGLFAKQRSFDQLHWTTVIFLPKD